MDETLIPDILKRFLESLTEDESQELLEFFDGNEDACSAVIEILSEKTK